MYKQSEWFLKMKENVTQIMGRVETSFNNAYKKNQALQKQLDENANMAKKFGHSVDELGLKLDNLTKKRNVSIDFKDVTKLNREILDVEKQLERIKGFGTKPGAWSMANLKEGVSQVPGLGGAMALGTNPYVIGGAAIAAGGKFAYDAAMTNLGFDQQFAKINATAQLKKPEMDALRNEIMGMGRNSSTDINQVPAAYEKILSATNDVRLSTDILRQSLQGAQAGFADVNDVASATTGIMNAVGAKKHSAKEVMDVLFASKRLGVGEFKDFANYLPAPIAQGNAIGYDYQQTASAFSYFTTRGRSADQSQTMLTNLFSALGRNETKKDLGKYGISLYDQNNKTKDLFSVITELKAKLDGKSDPDRARMVNDIFKDLQARDAINELLFDTKKLGGMMQETANSAGELKKALDSTENGMNDLQKLTNNWEAFKDNLGKAVAPALISVFQSLNGVLDAQNNYNSLQSMTPEARKQLLEERILESYRKKQFPGSDLTEYGVTMDQLGQFGDVKSRLQSLKAYSEITTEQIKKNPSLWGLRYKGKSGKMSDFYSNSDFTNSNSETKGLPPSGDNTDLTKTVDNISGGGSVKNFTVNIGKFQDKTEIHSANLTEGLDEVEKKQFDMFMRIVQGVELTAGAN